jgi:hypothetical protein
MDGDPAVDPKLDRFSRILPLPYRVALIIVLGTDTLYTAYSYPHPRRLRLTSHRRHLGVGSQPTLPLPHKDRCPKPDPLPRSLLTTPPLAPPLLLPHRDISLHSACALAPPLLDRHKRKPQGHCKLGDSAEPIPSRPCHRLRCADTIRQQKWQKPNACDAQADQHWRDS